MTFKAKNGQAILVRKLSSKDLEPLFRYLEGLSFETKRRFGPHPFDLTSIQNFYQDENHIGYLAIEASSSKIIAYAIIRKGYLEHDRSRLESYGLQLCHEKDCTFAPSVADAWQSQGIGKGLLLFILEDLKSIEIERIILWGGVQADNEKAVSFYKKYGFKVLGAFEYYGWNFDMVRGSG